MLSFAEWDAILADRSILEASLEDLEKTAKDLEKEAGDKKVKALYKKKNPWAICKSNKGIKTDHMRDKCIYSIKINLLKDLLNKKT